MPKSAYIHIPFCIQKCKYCSFVSYIQKDNIEEYLNALIKEIENSYKGEALDTVYFGGGTPSILKAEFVETILNHLKFNDNTEITFELNPDDADLEYLKFLRKMGINRLSMGAQTFDNKILKSIGRRHNSEEIIKAVDYAKQAGFSNISLDLIYGLPAQTVEILKNDLDIIASLDIQHISTYGLKIEEPSYFYKYPPQELPDDDMQADMYIFINKYLENNGYKRYEISNFSKTGYESRHNLNYWKCSEYYGFGAAAHGYNNGVRYSNFKKLADYMKNPLVKESENKLTEREKIEEEIFLGFRNAEGINIKLIYEKYNFDFEKEYKSVIDKYMPEYIVKTDFGYKFTLQGVLLSNIILAEFI